MSATLLLTVFPLALPAEAQSLRGSSASLDRQVRIAREHDFTFIRSSSQVTRFVEEGYLVRIRPDSNFELHAVSFPYARPEVKTFIHRLSEQYRKACGEELVITSLTRPLSRQPRNASDRSVHPTGMAMDIRRTNNRGCRAWLENVLLSLEATGVLEATRERNPPHYHVAIFPKPYARYVADLEARAADTRLASGSLTDYTVRRGDSLWTIAREHGISVEELQTTNGITGSRIYAGQLLQIPVAR